MKKINASNPSGQQNGISSKEKFYLMLETFLTENEIKIVQLLLKYGAPYKVGLADVLFLNWGDISKKGYTIKRGNSSQFIPFTKEPPTIEPEYNFSEIADSILKLVRNSFYTKFSTPYFRERNSSSEVWRRAFENWKNNRRFF